MNKLKLIKIVGMVGSLATAIVLALKGDYAAAVGVVTSSLTSANLVGGSE